MNKSKVHRDYGPANVPEQAKFIADLKKRRSPVKTAHWLHWMSLLCKVFPTRITHGQKKNTKPKIESDEQHREKLNGFLAVDVTRGDTHVEFKKHSTTAEAVFVIVFIILVYMQKGFTKLTFLLDNARIHGAKMEAGVQQLLAEIALQRTLPPLTLLFWHTPSYSPKLNPAEYIIQK